MLTTGPHSGTVGPGRSIATVLFTDIVGSTERAAGLGDRRWRELLRQHHEAVRGALGRFGGHEISTAGDGFLAIFDNPARAILCAAGIREEVRPLSLEIRCGLHMGEVEREGGDVGGIAVHIGARVAARAAPGEILVSGTVRDAEAGSDFQFEDRGRHELKGVPGEWNLYAVTALPEVAEVPPTPAGRRFRLSGRRPALFAAAIAVAFLVALAFLLTYRRAPSGGPGTAAAAVAAPGIAVLPFTVRGQGLDLWREGMVDLLSTGLDGTPGLRAIDSRTVLARWNERVESGGEADLATALDVAQSTGARYALLGSAIAIGPGVRLVADVYALDDGDGDGRSLGQAQVEGSPDSVLTLTDGLAVEILEVILRRDPGELPQVDLADMTTTSLPALKSYLEGEVRFRRSDFPAAIEAYETAIDADSTFALALFHASQCYGWTENIMSERALELVDQALRWSSRLPEREAILVRGEHDLLHGRSESLGALRQAVRKYPDDPAAWFLLGETVFHLGEQLLLPIEEADRAFAQVVALDPGFTPYHIHIIERAFMRADQARAAELVELYGRLAPETLQDRLNRFGFALAFGDRSAKAQAFAGIGTSEAMVRRPRSTGRMLMHPRFLPTREAVFRTARERSDATPNMVIGLWTSLYWRGRFADVAALMTDPLLSPDSRSAALYRLHAAGMTLPKEHEERELRVKSAGENSGPQLFHVGAYAIDRDFPEHSAAQRELMRLAARSSAAGDSVTADALSGLAQALEGYALWRQGQATQAWPILETAQRRAIGIGAIEEANATIRWWLGELALELDRPADAAPYFLSLWPDPLSHFHLAQLHETNGRSDRARAEYDYFALAWRDADPELQPLVERARSAATRAPRRRSPTTSSPRTQRAGWRAARRRTASRSAG